MLDLEKPSHRTIYWAKIYFNASLMTIIDLLKIIWQGSFAIFASKNTRIVIGYPLVIIFVLIGIFTPFSRRTGNQKFPRCEDLPQTSGFTISLMAARPGIEPKKANIFVDGQFQYIVTSVAPTSATVLSRNTGVATVTNGGLATGQGNGTTFIVATVGNGSCTSTDSSRITVTGDTPGDTLVGDAARGASVWFASCQECHGEDRANAMRFFTVPDTTTIRRAMAHVDTLSALDIVAHVHSLTNIPQVLTKGVNLYQPGSPATPVANDSMFAITLWGQDAFRSTLTRDSFLVINIRNVRIPMWLPAWSNDTSLYDWMPGSQFGGQIPAGVLANNQVQNSFATWRANGNMTNTKLLAEKIRTIGHDPNGNIPDAPCSYLTDLAQYDPQGCLDLAKWSSNFCYESGVRLGISADSILSACEKTWWETGHMAHKAQQFASNPACIIKCNIQRKHEQIAAWIYLGALKTLAANNDATLYFTAQPLGYERWMSFFIAMANVRRVSTNASSGEACSDIESMATFAKASGPWMLTQMRFLYHEMLRRISAGEQNPAAKGTCVGGASSTLSRAIIQVGNRSGQTVKDLLKPLSDSVIAAIQAQ